MNSSKVEEHGRMARETVLKYTWPSCLERFVKRLEEEKRELDEDD
jgi:hypothetical protein